MEWKVEKSQVGISSTHYPRSWDHDFPVIFNEILSGNFFFLFLFSKKKFQHKILL